MSSDKTSTFEVFVAILLGLAALCGGWAGYQSSQWGSTATEDYGRAATLSTRGSTLFNLGVTVAARDSALDVQAKQLVVTASTTKDPLERERDMLVAKYLITQQLSAQGYRALGYPDSFHTKDRAAAAKLPEDAVVKGLEKELDQKYLATVLADGNAKFAEADKVFAEGQKVSGTSTQFGLDGIFFTMALFFGGIGLVISHRLRWGFLAGGYAALGIGAAKMAMLPWYHA